MVHPALGYHAGWIGGDRLVGLLTQAVAMRHQNIAIRSPRLRFVFCTGGRRSVLPVWKKMCRSHDSESGGKFDVVEFHDDAPPEAERLLFVGEELLPSGHHPPFAHQDPPGLLDGEDLLVRVTSRTPSGGCEIRNFVANQGTEQTQVATRA